MENTVLIIGDSHLRRMADNFSVPAWFNVVAQPGAKLQIWEDFKDDIRAHQILVVVAGGNNVTAKPSDPSQSKESLKVTMQSFVELRKHEFDHM